MMMIGSAFVLLLLLGGFLLLLLVGGVFLARRGEGDLGLQEQRQQAPEQILDQRLARGEISEEEYDEIRARMQE
ncbi:MAG: SHOCT domain-containing protein [Anaerolineae bacterium]